MRSPLAPSPQQIEGFLDRLLTRDPKARFLAVRSPVRRPWPEEMVRGDRRFRLAWCESELAVRERLDTLDDAEDGLVVLTPLDASGLGCDVLARFPEARIRESDRWEALRVLFRVKNLDARLPSHGWLVDLLLDRAPSGGYPPAAGSALDLDTAWHAAATEILGLPGGRPDAGALLAWVAEKPDQLSILSEEGRQRVAERLAETGGAAALIAGAAVSGRGPAVLAAGLVCGVVFAAVPPPLELLEAAIRLEPCFGGGRIAPEAGRELATVARGRLKTLGKAEVQAAQDGAEALLRDIRADGFAGLSPALTQGFDARLRDVAHALATGNEVAVVKACAAVQEHDAAAGRSGRRRAARAEMAARLHRWLATPVRTQPDFASAALAYAEEGSFVDAARDGLRAGDEVPELAQAYARLSNAARARRELENERFASFVARWSASDASATAAKGVALLERVLATVVAPLAAERPVLLLVLDGLSAPVFRILAATFRELGWREIERADGSTPQAAVALLPTVTEICRASLLCGERTRGNAAAERAGFAQYGPLRRISDPDKPPRLFHKADLGGPELDDEVRDRLADPAWKVVGIVHNAVDAQLAGSDQVEIEWSADVLRQIAPILRVARDAGRVVVITGDHGHVLEDGTVQRAGSPGSRWRLVADAAPGSGEVTLSSGRVVPLEEAATIVAAWSEQVRYTSKKSNGYHGGASPQEMIVPLSVLAAGGTLKGWSGKSPSVPAWWGSITPAKR